jgi:hypothetical protein
LLSQNGASQSSECADVVFMCSTVQTKPQIFTDTMPHNCENIFAGTAGEAQWAAIGAAFKWCDWGRALFSRGNKQPVATS